MRAAVRPPARVVLGGLVCCLAVVAADDQNSGGRDMTPLAMLALAWTCTVSQIVSDPPPADVTSPAVREFLDDASARLYDPRAHGLKSLSFTLPIEDHLLGFTADVRVSWEEGAEATFDVGLRDLVPPDELLKSGMTVEEMSAGREAGSQAVARAFLDRLLGRLVGDALDGCVATLSGVEEGQVVVSFGPLPSSETSFKTLDLFIDEESVVSKIITLVNGSNGELKLISSFAWRRAKGGDQLLVEGTSLSGMLGHPTRLVRMREVTCGDQKVGELILLTQPRTHRMISPMTPWKKVVQTVRNLVVNGEPVEVVAPDQGPR